MTARYSKTSPYYTTSVTGNFLDVLAYRPIPKNPMDIKYTIDFVYEFRPDMLASDLYDNSGLWWVFAIRNPNVIADPIFDFYAGQIIYLPSKDTLISSMGM